MGARLQSRRPGQENLDPGFPEVKAESLINMFRLSHVKSRPLLPRLAMALFGVSIVFYPFGGGAAADAFVDVTAEKNISFLHVNGAVGKKLLPESMIGGAAWIDYDGDGRLDLYLVQGHGDSGKARNPGAQSNVLYRQGADGRFTDVSAKAGVADRGYGAGAAVGDYDNDGDADLYVTNFGRNTLYRNNANGTFTDISREAGVECPYWSASAAFADVNGDGLLDLFVTNYLIYDTLVHKACTGNSRKLPSYCHPNKYDGAPDSLFINRGGGRFEDISKQAGVTRTGRIMAKGLGVLPTDYDGDGDVDFLVANDSVPNFLWRNLGGGRFEDAALEAGVALNTHARSEACMGIDGGDVDGDGHIDYFMTNYAEETDTLYRGEGDGFFFDGTYKAGLIEATYKPLGFGTRLFDYDLDGDLDIYVTRGHIVQLIAELQPGKGLSYEQPDQLLENDGRGRFKDISARSGAWFSKRFVGRGAAFGDYDNDGDIDVYIVNLSQKGVLLRNNTIEGGRGGWVGLALRGGGPCNRDAYGSRVELRAAGRTLVAEVRSAASYLVANDPRVVFGLAAAPVAGLQARVRWADGLVEVFENLEAGRYQVLQRGKGRAAR
ncbi:MAG: hypothetical protein CMJ91_04025 [Planctomycetes bacterium]|nr:hypothetical protein [Planctomycetota bacterium]